MKDNKGLIFMPLMVFYTFLLLYTALYVLVISNQRDTPFTIGDEVVKLLQKNNDLIENEFFVIHGARYIFLVSLDKLLKTDSFVSDSTTNRYSRLNSEFGNEFNSFLAQNGLNNIYTTSFFSRDKKLVLHIVTDPTKIGLNPLKKDVPLSQEIAIDFDLDFVTLLYQKYSSLETDEQCRNVQKNELFDQYTVICTPENDYLRFNVETKNLGLVKSIITFKIAKPGTIEFTQK